MEVCIIGGGFSGIISAKYCKDEGLIPFILEKSRSPGGIWRGYAGEVGVWESMHTNNSKYSLTFSDHPWNPLSEEYPSWQEVGDYLNSYITKHNLQDYFHLNCKVTKVKNIQNKYIVKWENNGCCYQQEFEYVIIAAGLFVQTNTPLENSEIFQGTWLHSSSYRNPSIFSNKKVVCIGKNFSASDISCEALKTACSVTQVFKKSTLMINKYINNLPCELLTMTLDSILSCKTLFPSVSELLKIKQDLINLCGNPGNLHPLWKMNEQEPGSIYAVYADDNYINAIVSNKILLEQGKAKSFYSHGVVLENGKHIQADVVVLATGYHRTYEFLSKSIKSIVKYDSAKPGLSMSLFRSILHPGLPRLCFVGNIRAFIPARYELQAIIGIKFMLGKLDLSHDRLMQGVCEEDFIRNNSVDQDYDPKSYLCDLLQMVDPELSHKILKNELKFSNGIFLPQFIGIDNPDQLEKCKNVIEEIKSRHPDYICE